MKGEGPPTQWPYPQGFVLTSADEVIMSRCSCNGKRGSLMTAIHCTTCHSMTVQLCRISRDLQNSLSALTEFSHTPQKASQSLSSTPGWDLWLCTWCTFLGITDLRPKTSLTAIITCKSRIVWSSLPADNSVGLCWSLR